MIPYHLPHPQYRNKCKINEVSKAKSISFIFCFASSIKNNSNTLENISHKGHCKKCYLVKMLVAKRSNTPK